MFDLTFKHVGECNMILYEQLKDGQIRPTANQPYQKLVKENLKVIVLTNIEPNYELLGVDRVQTIYIEENRRFSAIIIENITDYNKTCTQNFLNKYWGEHNSKPK